MPAMIAVQSQSRWGPYMPATSIFLNGFLTQDDNFQGVLRLQAYMALIKTEIAGKYGPQRDQDYTHIWSLLQPKLQA